MSGHVRGDVRKANDQRLHESIARLEDRIAPEDLVAAYVLGQQQHREHPRPIDSEFLRRPTARELLDQLAAEREANQRAMLGRLR